MTVERQRMEASTRQLDARRARQGWGAAIAVALLLVVEAWLHTDAFLFKYRSVFAAGRAMDKVMYAERHCPSLLVLGNSRADNGFDPRAVAPEAGLDRLGAGFNLGLPGADSRVLAGIVDRLDRAGCLGPKGVRFAVVSLDEALVQPIDTLGQTVFFASRGDLWQAGQYHDWLKSWFRLYGFAPNLKQLREPASLQRFVQATARSLEPVGGSAAQHLGYRAGFGGLQDAQAAVQQEVGSSAPPDAVNVAHLWKMLDRLAAKGVRVAVVHPPLLGRRVLYTSVASEASAPYRQLAEAIDRRGIPRIDLGGEPRQPTEFVNAGHLNDRGAQRFSRLLGQGLRRVWGDPQAATLSTVPMHGARGP